MTNTMTLVLKSIILSSFRIANHTFLLVPTILTLCSILTTSPAVGNDLLGLTSVQRATYENEQLIRNDKNMTPQAWSNRQLWIAEGITWHHYFVKSVAKYAEQRAAASFGLPDCSSGRSVGMEHDDTVIVDPLGDDLNDGTPERPVRSIARAMALVSRGDRHTVWLRKGIYRLAEPVVLTATMGGISILGCSGAPVVLDGQATSPALVLSAVRDVVVAGLTFMGAYPVQIELPDCG